HPALAGIVEVTTDDAGLRIVGDLHEGTRLSDWLDGRPVARDRVLQWGIRLAGALAALHEVGQSHGHLGPDTITVTTRDHVLVRENPHGALGGAHDDVVGLGRVLFAMLTGEPTHTADEARHRLRVV